MKKYIGVFDSGLGGLTSVKEIIRQLPHENIVFLADSAHVPYGSRSRDEIRQFSRRTVRFLNTFPLSCLLIACNTSDANAGDLFRSNAEAKVFGVIEPAIRQSLTLSKNKKIGLLATKLTVESGKYEKILAGLDPDAVLYPMACPELVPLIEEGRFSCDDEETVKVFKEYLDPLLKENIDTLILGCTHYDTLMPMAEMIAPGLKIVSSSRSVVDEIGSYLKENGLLNTDPETERKYFTTAKNEQFDKVAKLIINDMETIKVDI